MQSHCIKAMQYWIPAATWTPISGGLASNPDYKDLLRRSEDQNDSLTEMCVFGGLSLNNLARAERKQLRQVNLLYCVIHHICFNRLMYGVFSLYCRRQSRRRRFNGRPQSGMLWAILPIHPPDHHHHHRYAPASCARFLRAGHPPHAAPGAASGRP